MTNDTKAKRIKPAIKRLALCQTSGLRRRLVRSCCTSPPLSEVPANSNTGVSALARAANEKRTARQARPRDLNELVALGLHDDLAQHEVRRGVDGLQNQIRSGRDGDHFVALDGHLDFVPERCVHSAQVE